MKNLYLRHKRKRIAEIRLNRKENPELVYPDMYKIKNKKKVFGAVMFEK